MSKSFKGKTSSEFLQHLDNIDPKYYEVEKKLSETEKHLLRDFTKFVNSDSDHQQVSKCGKYYEPLE